MNFLEIEGHKDRSNIWRGAAAVFVIILAAGSFVSHKIDWQNKEQEIFNRVLEPLHDIRNLAGGAGGDVNIVPPESVKPKLPELTGEMLNQNSFSAVSIIVKDTKTGMVLYQKNEYREHPIASVTKLMSALVLLEERPVWSTSTVVIGEDSLDANVYAGEVYTLEDLWSAALIGSSNKAVLSLVNALAWPQEAFVERMNQKASELGMLSTHFTDPTGIDEGNISSASDLAILLNEALQKEKIKKPLLTTECNMYPEKGGKSRHIWNTDWLLLGWVPHTFPEFYGGKTGFITASGYNFVMRVGDGKGHTIDVVVLGTKDHEARFTEARDVAEWAFANYKWPDQ